MRQGRQRGSTRQAPGARGDGVRRAPGRGRRPARPRGAARTAVALVVAVLASALHPAVAAGQHTAGREGQRAPVTVDLALTKEIASDDPIAPGETFEYTLVVRNTERTATATGVRVTDNLPETLRYVRARVLPPGRAEPAPVDCPVDGRRVRCPALDQLHAGEAAIYTLTVRLAPSYRGTGEDVENHATVESDHPDPDPVNNGDLAGVPGEFVKRPTADLAVTKRPVTGDRVAPGETFAYDLAVTNKGPSTARTVRLSDTLPPALGFAGSRDGCTAHGQRVSCPPHGELPDDGTVVRRVTVRLDPGYAGDGGEILNRATATAETRDPDHSNNSGPVPGVGLPDRACDVSEPSRSGPNSARVPGRWDGMPDAAEPPVCHGAPARTGPHRTVARDSAG
ncbi:DUF11 domain-containing protein [Streptomyces sp. AJS327]|uniref:DUF11 domain-containing protein n=1 Tax=Streptomyces sp. AJS327 TaxID=2545265 RepID=UPI0015E025B6|nr:DUF11 domain-containing protein [Streptomyces sp. AJS327]MBA0052760.1 DUF11 domain-containing protein [Streptomyces sp. AJS327]